jgi:moderate conductance mechanosensitive channel
VAELAVAIPEFIRHLAEILKVDASELIRKLIQVALIWLLTWVGLHVVALISRRIERAVDDGNDSYLSEREQRGHTISQLLRSVGKVLLLTLALMLTLNVFVDIAPLLAGAGILGLAVSFGAQSLVKDVISGFFYLIEGQFAVGDVIEIAGKSGVVERMTLRVVMLRDINGTLHVIPNGQISTVSNMTRGWSRAVVDVGVAYGTDVDKALVIFRSEAQRMLDDTAWSAELDGTPEVVGVNDLADSGVTIRTLLRTLPGKQWRVAREFRRRIKNRLDHEGIEIPFPQRTMHIRVAGDADPRAAAALLAGPTAKPIPGGSPERDGLPPGAESASRPASSDVD